MSSSNTPSDSHSSSFRCIVQTYDDRGYGLGPYTTKAGSLSTARIFNAIDGEEIQAEKAVRSKRGKGVQDLLDPIVITPSPHRVSPKCAHFGTCGGCVFQHISIDHQKSIKEQKIQSLFDPFKKYFNYTLRPLIGASEEGIMKPWEYRNKMEFSFAMDRQGKRFLGLYDRLGRGVTSLQECHLVSPWVVKALSTTMKWWEEKAPHLRSFHPRTGEGTLRTVTFREGITTGDRMVILTVSSKPEFAPTKRDLLAFQTDIEELLLEEMAEKKTALSIVLRIHQAIPKQPTQIYEMILRGPDYIREKISLQLEGKEKCEYIFHISPQAFFQPNSVASSTIYQSALELADISQNDIVYDLYCGTGTFGMFAAKYAHKVIAIELSKDAAYDAKTNASRLQLSNFHIHCGDVGTVLGQLHIEKEEMGSSIAIIDPPRSGLLPAAISQIIQLAPKRIVYVSCNPERQVFDIEELRRMGSYELKTLQPIDQFPHTPHIENIALLERC